MYRHSIWFDLHLKGVHLFSASPKLCCLFKNKNRGRESSRKHPVENTPREGDEAALSTEVSRTQRVNFCSPAQVLPVPINCNFLGC